jgi:hypothetical protein
MKNIGHFSIEKYNKFAEIIGESEIDYVELFNLFNLDLKKMKADEFLKNKIEIENSIVEQKKGVEKFYVLNGNRYKATLNLTKITAAQFIDLQIHKSTDIHKIIATFLLPTRNRLFGTTTYNYNEGYDIQKVYDDVEKYMRIDDAMALSAFFLTVSEKLLKIMENSLVRRKINKMKKKYEI